MTSLRKLIPVGLGALLILSGCAAAAPEGYEGGAVEASIGYEEAAMLEDSALMAPEARQSVGVEPDVITTGYLSMSVDSPADVADQIETVVTDAGGRVASRSDYSPVDFGQPSTYLDVRIPSGELEGTVAQIRELGQVQEVSLNTVDVSLQKVDLDARIEVLEAAIERLSTLLSTAETTSDLVTIESALSERQAELDSLRSQRDYLSDQTLFATLSINLITPADATPSDPDGFVDGLIRGWESVLAFFAGVIVWAGILVPWVGLGLAVLLVVWAVRALASKRTSTPKP